MFYDPIKDYLQPKMFVSNLGLRRPGRTSDMPSTLLSIPRRTRADADAVAFKSPQSAITHRYPHLGHKRCGAKDPSTGQITKCSYLRKTGGKKHPSTMGGASKCFKGAIEEQTRNKIPEEFMKKTLLLMVEAHAQERRRRSWGPPPYAKEQKLWFLDLGAAAARLSAPPTSR